MANIIFCQSSCICIITIGTPQQPPPPTPEANPLPVPPKAEAPPTKNIHPPEDPAFSAVMKEEVEFNQQYKDWKKQYEDWKTQNQRKN